MPQAQQRDRKTAILTSQGLQKLEAAKLKVHSSNGQTKTYTLEALSAYTGLSTHTLSKIHNRQVGADIRSLTRYFTAFDLTLDPSDYCPSLSFASAEPSHPMQNKPGCLDIVPPPELSHAQPLVSWGIAPDVSHFYGRTAELARLQHWIIADRCRLVNILGMGGIGKTYLATKLAEQIQPEFKVVIWRSLRPISRSHSPLPFHHFLDDLIGYLTPHPTPSAPITAKIRHLIDRLKQTPLLLVLDNVESIVQNPTPASGDRLTAPKQADYEAYVNLLTHIGQARHHSCVVLTSRTEPPLLRSMAGNTLEMRSLSLGGLPVADIQPLLRAKGTFQGTIADWNCLVNYYNGNPLLLSIVVRTIQRLFNGSITEFLQHKTLIFDEIRDFLDQHLGWMSDPEIEVIRVLATQNASLSFGELRSHISPVFSTTDLLESLKSLNARSLIESRAAQLFLQPLLRDYVKERFVSSI